MTRTAERVSALRKQGMSFGEIANKLNISRSGAWRSVNTKPKEKSALCQHCGGVVTVKTSRLPERCPMCRRYRWTT